MSITESLTLLMGSGEVRQIVCVNKVVSALFYQLTVWVAEK